MRLTFKQIGFGAAAVSAVLGLSGCDEASKACDAVLEAELLLELEEKGCGSVADGEASITGVGSIDGFFASVVKFGDTAGAIGASIDAELDGIQADFGITDADISAEGSLGAALSAKFDANTTAGVTIRMEPAKCEVDAQASFSASADCQVEAGCEVEVDPGMVEFECSGGCEVEASASVDCGVDVDVSCDFQGPSVACMGSCEGTCTVEAGVAGGCEGSCSGTCEGKCEGTCSGGTDQDGNCMGSCDGTCKGTCDAECTFEASAKAECEGTCEGTCTMTGPELDCSGAASAKCEGSAEAKASCSGKCDGDFQPPMAMAMCEASASCNASAKADASIDVVCTPPSIEIAYELDASLDAEASVEFKAAINGLRARLPALAASLKKGDVVISAGADLIAAGEDAGEGFISLLTEGDSELGGAAKIRVGYCALPAFAASASVVGDASAGLGGSVEAGASLVAELGL